MTTTKQARTLNGRSDDSRSKLVGLFLGVGLAGVVGVAFWLATQRAADDNLATGLDGATVSIVDCPREIVLDTSPLCGIVTENVVEAHWAIDGFGAGPVEKLDTQWQMFINPTNPDVVGLEFVFVVTATGHDGDDIETRHQFRVIE